MTDEPVVAVPADLELEERLVGPVTFRMAAWLAASAAGAVLLGAGGLTAGRLALGAPLLLVGLVGAFWRPGGRAATSWLRPMAGYLRRQRADRTAARNKAAARRSATAEPAPTPPGPRAHLPGGRRAELSRLTSPRTRRSAAAAAALVLIGAAFAGGRLARAHQSRPAPALPIRAPAPTAPFPGAGPSPTSLDPWSDCGC